jgi:hypothetical protein
MNDIYLQAPLRFRLALFVHNHLFWPLSVQIKLPTLRHDNSKQYSSIAEAISRGKTARGKRCRRNMAGLPAARRHLALN